MQVVIKIKGWWEEGNAVSLCKMCLWQGSWDVVLQEKVRFTAFGLRGWGEGETCDPCLQRQQPCRPLEFKLKVAC